MSRNVRIVFESETENAYDQLLEDVAEEKKRGTQNSDDQRLLKSIDHKVELLKINPMAGIQIERRLIPKVYMHKYDIDNLWKINLVNYWRMLYSIKGDKVEIMCFILDIMDHDRYNKIFGYRKR